MKKTKILLVRHGQTDWNVSGKYQGFSDVPLNKLGLRQAEFVAEELKNENIDRIYSSDLSRAKITAEAIASLKNKDVETKKDLREMHFGLWEGMTYPEIKKDYAKTLEKWFQDPRDLVVPEGESVGFVQKRAQDCLENIVSENNNKTVLIVAHGLTIITLLCSILEIDLKNIWKMRINNTGISALEFYNKCGILTLFNDTNHLINK